MNGSHLRVASHLRTLAYSIRKLCGYLLPHVAFDLLKHVPFGSLAELVLKTPRICNHLLCNPDWDLFFFVGFIFFVFLHM